MRVVLSDRRGNPTGTRVEAEASILEGEEGNRMLEVFRKDYGTIGYSVVGLVGRMRGFKQMTTVISIRLLSQAKLPSV